MFSTALNNTILTVSARALEGEAAAQNPMAGGISSILILVVFVAFMYFFIMRPQKKQEAETKKMRDSIIVGDEVTTIGGLFGRVCNVRDDTITIENGADRTRIKVARWAIRSIEKKFGEAENDETKKTAYKVKKSEKTEENK